jgi:transposase-like protein
VIQPPTRCPRKNLKTRRPCGGTRFKLHQVHCRKPVGDLRHSQALAQRYRCLKCGRTFRVYPPGVTHAQLTASLKALCVLMYMLGLTVCMPVCIVAWEVDDGRAPTSAGLA